jgi:hypothetical protein
VARAFVLDGSCGGTGVETSVVSTEGRGNGRDDWLLAFPSRWMLSPEMAS